jgi:hypothetical protein
MPPATGTAVYTRRPEAVGVAAAVIEAVDSSIKTPGYGWRTQQCRNMGVPPTSLKAKKLGKLQIPETVAGRPGCPQQALIV